jgi:hypothetical protein
MYRNKLIEPIGFIIALATFLFSLILFYSNTGMFWGSFAAALLAAGLFWISYVILRLVVLTFRS